VACYEPLTKILNIRSQVAELKGQLAAAHAEIDASAAKVADAASVHSQIDWLHHRLQSSMEEVQVSTAGPCVPLDLYHCSLPATACAGSQGHIRGCLHGPLQRQGRWQLAPVGQLDPSLAGRQIREL
jgi:hypothetical protein